MRTLFLFLTIFCSAEAQVILSEVMIDPDAPESSHEFVELYNAGVETVALDGWEIGDGKGWDEIISLSGGSLLLEPGQYGIVLDPDYFDSEAAYDSLIPESALVATIGGSTFGSAGFSNSTSEVIQLIDSGSDTLEIYEYEVDFDAGHSHEKASIHLGAAPAVWTQSLQKHGTPGKQNSVIAHEWDLSVLALDIVSLPVTAGVDIELLATVANAGRQSVQFVEWSLFVDNNLNGQFDSEELLVGERISVQLDSSDTSRIEIVANLSGYGEYVLGFEAVADPDEEVANNLVLTSLFVDDPTFADVVINEILFEPISGKPEWVELYNNGSQPVDLGRLNFADSRDTVPLATTPLTIEPGEYMVISGDSSVVDTYNLEENFTTIVRSLPTLNNDYDVLQILGPTYLVYDRVQYTSDWYGRDVFSGTSLEKIHPGLNGDMASNWAASVESALNTPGRRNSVYVEVLPSTSNLEITPNPFSPDGDGHEDVTFIQFNLPAETAFANVRIFDLRGRLIRRIVNAAPIANSGQLTWDGKDEAGRIARIGAYICLFEALNGELGLSSSLKQTIILIKQ